MAGDSVEPSVPRGCSFTLLVPVWQLGGSVLASDLLPPAIPCRHGELGSAQRHAMDLRHCSHQPVGLDCRPACQPGCVEYHNHAEADANAGQCRACRVHHPLVTILWARHELHGGHAHAECNDQSSAVQGRWLWPQLHGPEPKACKPHVRTFHFGCRRLWNSGHHVHWCCAGAPALLASGLRQHGSRPADKPGPVLEGWVCGRTVSAVRLR
mmetsp:Transcript_40397/g.102250  ORF Transcript_40397/g.102250 Transcript_40397/m.102250 type:complete len:211 (+) Transcript_40397:1418-2050(+)